MLKNRLVQLRKQKGISQYEAADRLNISRGKLSNYEQGSRQPDYEMLKQIADFYDVTTDYLLGYSENKNKEISKREEYLHKISTEFPNIDLMFDDLASFTAEDLQDVYDYIKFKKSQKKKD